MRLRDVHPLVPREAARARPLGRSLRSRGSDCRHKVSWTVDSPRRHTRHRTPTLPRHKIPPHDTVHGQPTHSLVTTQKCHRIAVVLAPSGRILARVPPPTERVQVDLEALSYKRASPACHLGDDVAMHLTSYSPPSHLTTRSFSQSTGGRPSRSPVRLMRRHTKPKVMNAGPAMSQMPFRSAGAPQGQHL